MHKYVGLSKLARRVRRNDPAIVFSPTDIAGAYGYRGLPWSHAYAREVGLGALPLGILGTLGGAALGAIGNGGKGALVGALLGGLGLPAMGAAADLPLSYLRYRRGAYARPQQ